MLFRSVSQSRYSWNECSCVLSCGPRWYYYLHRHEAGIKVLPHPMSILSVPEYAVVGPHREYRIWTIPYHVKLTFFQVGFSCDYLGGRRQSFYSFFCIRQFYFQQCVHLQCAGFYWNIPSFVNPILDFFFHGTFPLAILPSKEFISKCTLMVSLVPGRRQMRPCARFSKAAISSCKL